MKWLPLSLVLFAAASFQNSWALSPSFPDSHLPLVFQSKEILNLRLQSTFSTLFDAKKLDLVHSKKLKVEGELSYSDLQNHMVKIPVEIRLRGFSTLANCPFPKLQLKLKSGAAGTVFDGMKALDLDTHCTEENDRDVNLGFRSAFFNHREALVYEMMNVLSMPTFHVRRVMMQYTDLDSPSRVNFKNNFSYQAFLIEDMNTLTQRLGAQEIKDYNDTLKVIADPSKQDRYQFHSAQESPKMDLEDVARLELFQHMVGNGDWFLRVTPQEIRDTGGGEGLWNSKMIVTSDGRWVPMGQDFSLSGVAMGIPVSTLHATQWKLSSTETREKIKNLFRSRRSALEQLLRTFRVDDLGVRNTQVLMDQFYQGLDSL